MIRKYIQNIILESYEKDLKGINEKEKQLIEKMIHDAMIKKKFATKLSILKFIHACKIGKTSNINTEKIIEYKFKYNTGGPTGRPSNKKQVIINNITPEILKHSNFLRNIIHNKYNEIRGQSARQRAEYEVASTYGMPAHPDMDSHTARGYGYIFQKEFNEYVEQLIPKYEQMIEDEARKYKDLLDD
tara:strand:+ start:176 stop:736 length:561 start_codon:yes stop_codon:yes gene_type:complete